jgi:hypothetical protein
VPITRDRAERIAKAHACVNCGEYSYKRLVVRPAVDALREELGEEWHVLKVCGVCGLQEELGLDAEGDVLYAS